MTTSTRSAAATGTTCCSAEPAKNLYGELGNDKMAGGADGDTYYVDRAKDTVIESKNQGYDIVHTVVSYTLSANVEELVIDGTGDAKGTGNALGNLLDGNDGRTSWMAPPATTLCMAEAETTP